MATTDRAADRGRRLGRQLGGELGRQLRLARVARGLSQAQVGRACGISFAAIGRLERGERRSVGLVELSGALAIVGLELSARTYPSGRPLRDRGHGEVLELFHMRLPSDLPWRLEVPFPLPGDQRAWDAMLQIGGLRIGVEAETRPMDAQELLRHLNLKRRDGMVDRLVLLLPDTRHNRSFLRATGGSFTAAFPIPGRVALRRFEAGEDPGGDAIVLVPRSREQAHRRQDPV